MHLIIEGGVCTAVLVDSIKNAYYKTTLLKNSVVWLVIVILKVRN
jgi:hypothetical protein